MIQLCDRKRNRLIQPDFATSFLSAKCCGNKISILISISSILLHLGLQVFYGFTWQWAMKGKKNFSEKILQRTFKKVHWKNFWKGPPSPHSCRKNRQELIIVQHLLNVHIGKLDFIWLAKKDNLMLLNWWPVQDFSFNLNTRNVIGMTPFDLAVHMYGY